MIETTVERAAISAAQPTLVTPYGAFFPVLQVLSALTEWRTKGVHYVTFDSKLMDFEVRVGYSVDDEEEFPDLLLLEVWAGSFDLSLHLNKAALDALEDELADAVREQDSRTQGLAQEDQAQAQLELEEVL